MLIDDINHYGCKCISCNITSFITDHLSQFIIIKNFKKNNIADRQSQTEFSAFGNFIIDVLEKH